METDKAAVLQEKPCEESSVDRETTEERSSGGSAVDREPIGVTLLTGGGDKPYALGIAAALSSHGVSVDFIGSDDLDVPELRQLRSLNFLNLRGDQRTKANLWQKAIRILNYYGRLMRYAITAGPRVFHILWNNKFEFFDRTLLLLYYKACGKGIVLTAHNVNVAARDSNDTFLNRTTLRVQYRLVDHIFVHTERMRDELTKAFAVPRKKVSVIPFGVNNTLATTALTTLEAKRSFGLYREQKTILFFGNIAPYKGLDDLVAALGLLAKEASDYRLIIAGRTKGSDEYWGQICETIAQAGLDRYIIQRIDYIPDDQVEVYFKAADVIVLPYKYIFQSGVLFLAYAFGLPVIASDVGSMKEDIIEGRTGFVCQANNPTSIAAAIKNYFGSDLFEDRDERRSQIIKFANEKYSWDKVAEITRQVYVRLGKSESRLVRLWSTPQSKRLAGRV